MVDDGQLHGAHGIRWVHRGASAAGRRHVVQVVTRHSRVRHSYEIALLPGRPMRALYGVLLPQHCDMRPQMQSNLERLRDLFTAGAR
jgi:hypothetical protein